MPVNLNLLPQNLQVSKGLGRILKSIKAMGVILIAAFIVFCLGVGGLFIYYKISLSGLDKNINQLKVQVKAQETSEQQLILLKDRLSKISLAKSTPDATKNLINLNSLFANSTNLSITDANISPTKIDLTLLAVTNEDLTNAVQSLKSTKFFNLVDLTSFSYGLGSGFSMTATLGSK